MGMTKFPVVRYDALRSLKTFRNNAAPFRSQVAGYLSENETASVQVMAIKTLAAMGEEANDCYAKIADLLASEHDEVREAAVVAFRDNPQVMNMGFAEQLSKRLSDSLAITKENVIETFINSNFVQHFRTEIEHCLRDGDEGVSKLAERALLP